MTTRGRSRASKRKTEFSSDESEFKVSAKSRRRNHSRKQKGNNNTERTNEMSLDVKKKILQECDDDYRLEFSYDEPLDGRSWTADRPVVIEKTEQADENKESHHISDWLEKLGFDEELSDSLDSDISDYSVDEEGLIVKTSFS